MVLNRSFFIKWCLNCNVPVLGPKCGCGSQGKSIKISAPGDIRFALKGEAHNVDKVISRYYGKNTRLKSKLILANNRPGLDRDVEIVVDGLMVGLVSFDIVNKDYVFIPSAEGEWYFVLRTMEKIKEVDVPLGGFLKGKVFGTDRFVIDREYGLVRMKRNKKLLFIRKRDKDYKIIDVLGRVEYSSKINSVQKMIDQNRHYLDKITSKSVDIIREFLKKNKGFPVNVAFSGGKDSLVVLDLVRSIVPDVDCYYVDTGVEFPQTVRYVQGFYENVEILRPKINFFELFGKLGPPAKDCRWCCKTLKLGPVVKHIREKYGGRCLTFEGKRLFESFARERSSFESRNPHVLGQVSVYPILQWRAIDVFAYIFLKKLRYNQLYDLGLERVGCYLCPAQSEEESRVVLSVVPELSKDWKKMLYKWSESNNFSRKYVNLGFWRWKSLPGKMRELARQLGISTVSTQKKQVSQAVSR